MQVRNVFQVLRGVISEFYVLFPGSMLNHRPVCIPQENNGSSKNVLALLLKSGWLKIRSSIIQRCLPLYTFAEEPCMILV